MLSYILKRLLLTVPILLIVVTLVFFLLRLVPGDPVDFILGENALPEAREQLVKVHHFDESIDRQYLSYLTGVSKGDFGASYFSESSVSTLVAQRLPATVELAVAALLWAMAISFPAGMLAAIKAGGQTDRAVRFGTLLGVSMPGFYLGPLLALVFAIKLDWLPLSGRELPGSLILPSLTLGLALSALLTRLVRSTLLEVLYKDYVRTARAKGLSPTIVIVKHAFRTALVPVVAVMGLQLGALLTGAVVTEKIFNWPGLGTLLLEAVSKRDYAVVQGCVLTIAAIYAGVNLLTDTCYAWLDPRVRVK